MKKTLIATLLAMLSLGVILWAIFRTNRSDIGQVEIHKIVQSSQSAESKLPSPPNMEKVTVESNTPPSGPLQEIEVFSLGFQKLSLPEAQMASLIRNREAKLRDVIAKDIAAGINAEVRAREQELLRKAEALQSGMDVNQVIQTLGSPDRIQMLIVHSDQRTLKQVSLIEATAGKNETYWAYWPRVGVTFDGRNGQGYKVLYVLFDSDGKLAKWLWQQPTVAYFGSIRMVEEQKAYWEGNMAKSPPPPENYIDDAF